MKGKHFKQISALLAAAILVFGIRVLPFDSIKWVYAVSSQKMKLNHSLVTMQTGTKRILKITKDKPSSVVKWSSSNKKVAVVSREGVVRAKKEGTAIITAEAEKGKKTAKCRITVFNAKISSFPLLKGENGKAPTITLNSGYKMPVLGLGTYSLEDEVCINSVTVALEAGVRKIDTAYIYDNEESVGKGIKKSGVPREEIFVTTKLYMDQYDNAEKAIDDALKRLDLEYIDLMLLHHPDDNDVKAYKALEKAVRQGKIRSIGLSNYYIKEMKEFLPKVSITPALVQNEIHPFYQEKEVVEYMHTQGIVVEAWYPFGGRGYTEKLLNNKTIGEIAKAHEVSSAQVILRWHLQRGVVAIPGSSNPDHIKENISVFGFKLSKEEMNQIEKLDRDEKHDWY